MLMFEWDEAKRLVNIEKHGLDFVRGTQIFDGQPVFSFAARYEMEPRVVTVGKLDDGKFYTVIWTQRIALRRFISFRRARHGEETGYFALHG